MEMQELPATVRTFDGVLEVAPTEGDGFPESAWGDRFFYYAPGGEVPHNAQPYATIVTKDYPGDTRSELDPADRWRANIRVGKAELTRLLGEDPRSFAARGFSVADVLHPRPVYASLGWVPWSTPASRPVPPCVSLLRAAHEDTTRRRPREGRCVGRKPGAADERAELTIASKDLSAGTGSPGLGGQSRRTGVAQSTVQVSLPLSRVCRSGG